MVWDKRWLNSSHRKDVSGLNFPWSYVNEISHHYNNFLGALTSSISYIRRVCESPRWQFWEYKCHFVWYVDSAANKLIENSRINVIYAYSTSKLIPLLLHVRIKRGTLVRKDVSLSLKKVETNFRLHLISFHVSFRIIQCCLELLLLLMQIT